MKKLLAILLAAFFILGGAGQALAEANEPDPTGAPEQQTAQPVEQQTAQPAEQQTAQPVEQQTAQPAEQQTAQPAEQQTAQPAEQQTAQPAEQQTAQPAEQQTAQPAEQQTAQPAEQQTAQPTDIPAQPAGAAPAEDYVTMKEGDWRIVMGANLSEEQRAQVFSVFGLKGEIDASKLLTVTNAEERFYFEGKLPAEKIGTRAVSCIYIKALKQGKGLKVETHNIDYCTPEMYVNVLTTVGITDAEIIVAAPTTVSGTAALTGVYKAYESLTGGLLNEYAKLAGIDELLATGELAEMIGSDEATEIINELKKILDETQHMSDEEVKQKIREIADEYDVELNETEISQILTLSRTLEGLDTEQIRQRALGLVNAANGWKKFTQGVANAVEKIGEFFKEVAQFFKELFAKWFS